MLLLYRIMNGLYNRGIIYLSRSTIKYSVLVQVQLLDTTRYDTTDDGTIYLTMMVSIYKNYLDWRGFHV